MYLSTQEYTHFCSPLCLSAQGCTPHPLMMPQHTPLPKKGCTPLGKPWGSVHKAACQFC